MGRGRDRYRFGTKARKAAKQAAQQVWEAEMIRSLDLFTSPYENLIQSVITTRLPDNSLIVAIRLKNETSTMFLHVKPVEIAEGPAVVEGQDLPQRKPGK